MEKIFRQEQAIKKKKQEEATMSLKLHLKEMRRDKKRGKGIYAKSKNPRRNASKAPKARLKGKQEYSAKFAATTSKKNKQKA